MIRQGIFWKNRLEGRLHRAKREDFSQEAKRPKYSKLDSSKLEKAIGEKFQVGKMPFVVLEESL